MADLDLKLHYRQTRALLTTATEVLYGGSAGGGKAKALDTEILTEQGFTTFAGIKVGDRVFDEQGNPCNVIAVSEVMHGRPCYRLDLDDNTSFVADAGHLWITHNADERAKAWHRTPEFREQRRQKRQKRGVGKRPDLAAMNANRVHEYLPPPAPVVRNTQEIFETQTVRGGRVNHSIPLVSGPLKLPQAELPLQPYVLGVWLADGTRGQGGITTGDPEIMARVASLGYRVTKRKGEYGYGILGISKVLRELGVLRLKRIPEQYMMASEAQRRELFFGLMDSDGYCAQDGGAEYCSMSRNLAEDVFRLACSMGIKATLQVGRASLGGKDYGEKYRVMFTTTSPAFWLPRKRKRQNTECRATQKQRYIVRVTAVPSVPVRCIEVDSPSKCFLVGRNLVPTHNSFLMRAASIIWAAEIPGLQVYLFRRLSDDLFKNHMTGIGSYPEILAPWVDARMAKWSGSKNYWSFWNGSKIWLCHCQYEKDLLKYLGAEVGALLLDEATTFTASMYRYLRGRLRLGGTELPVKYEGLFPRILACSNPGNIGHAFFKAEFIDPCPPMAIRKMPQKDGGMRRQYIPARLTDNPTLMKNDPHYADRLHALGDPVLVRAMLEGDWNIVAGGALDDVWSDKLVVPRFPIPHNWKSDRAMDWGSTHPFSIGWWAVANGETVTLPNGKTFTPHAGSLINFYEWYGAKDMHENEGLRLGPVELAKGIKQREALLMAGGWIKRLPGPGPVDSQIYDVNDSESGSLAKRMEAEGVKWVPADKKSGSRVNGLQLLRQRMKTVRDGHDGPGIYFMDCCLVPIALLPILPRDAINVEDVDTKSLDHQYDQTRYRVLHEAKQWATKLDMGFSC